MYTSTARARREAVDFSGINFGDDESAVEIDLSSVIEELIAQQTKIADTEISIEDFKHSADTIDQQVLEAKCDKYFNTNIDTAITSISDDFWDDLELRQEDVDKMSHAEFLVPNLLVKGHVAAFISPGNGGKTTLFKFLCEQLTKKDLKVIYINVDGNPDDLKRHHRHAKEFGYKVISPDARDGKNTGDALLKLKQLADSAEDLSDTVFIIDTLKKFVDMLNKSRLKETIQMFRKLSVKGATVALLGHSNKYPDANGDLVYEGTADLRNDLDDLIYLIPAKDEVNKIQIITTKPDKVRAGFEPVSYQIDFNNDRKVTLLREVATTVSSRDKELIAAIKEAIESGDDNQKAIISYVKQKSVLGENSIRKFLIENSTGENALWVTTKTGSNNVSVQRDRLSLALALALDL